MRLFRTSEENLVVNGEIDSKDRSLLSILLNQVKPGMGHEKLTRNSWRLAIKNSRRKIRETTT